MRYSARERWPVPCIRLDRAQPVPDAMALLDGLAGRRQIPEDMGHFIYVLAETDAGCAEFLRGASSVIRGLRVPVASGHSPRYIQNAVTERL